MSRAIVINGSTRENGNTDTILDEFIRGAKSTDIDISYVKLRDLDIANCIGCCTCREEGECHFDDDMTHIREQLEHSKYIVFASPLYWCEVTGLMKTFVDRLYFYHHPQNSSLVANKIGLIITPLGEDENVGYETEVINEFYKRVFKSLDFHILDMLSFPGLMEKEDIFKKSRYLIKAFQTGKNLLHLPLSQ